MYRKVVFISVCFFNQLEIFSKTTLLLFFSSISFILTFQYKPFQDLKTNTLEFYSNLAVIITIYMGALYLSEIGDSLKFFCFLCIFSINGIFFLVWGLLCFEVFYINNLNYIRKRFKKSWRHFLTFMLFLNKISKIVLPIRAKYLQILAESNTSVGLNFD